MLFSLLEHSEYRFGLYSGPNETQGIGIKLTIFIKFHPWIKILRGKVIDQNTDDSSKDSVVKEEKKIGDNFYFFIY